MQSNKAMHQQHVICLINMGFLPVKTWLLIACDTAFYAIIAKLTFTCCRRNIVHFHVCFDGKCFKCIRMGIALLRGSSLNIRSDMTFNCFAHASP